MKNKISLFITITTLSLFVVGINTILGINYSNFAYSSSIEYERDLVDLRVEALKAKPNLEIITTISNRFKIVSNPIAATVIKNAIERLIEDVKPLFLKGKRTHTTDFHKYVVQLIYPIVSYMEITELKLNTSRKKYEYIYNQIQRKFSTPPFFPSEQHYMEENATIFSDYMLDDLENSATDVRIKSFLVGFLERSKAKNLEKKIVVVTKKLDYKDPIYIYCLRVLALQGSWLSFDYFKQQTLVNPNQRDTYKFMLELMKESTTDVKLKSKVSSFLENML